MVFSSSFFYSSHLIPHEAMFEFRTAMFCVYFFFLFLTLAGLSARMQIVIIIKFSLTGFVCLYLP